MKFVNSLLFALVACAYAAHAQQVTVSVDRVTGDSIITTEFDTLHQPLPDEKDAFPDKVVGVKTITKEQSTYWLFFYFSTADITHNPVKISKKNFAYFVKNNNEYLRIPYSGRPFNYSNKDNAGFFVDITKYVDNFLSSPIKIIRLETSVYYHEILLSEEKKESIAKLIRVLN